MNIKRHTYDKNQISAILADGHYLWIAFKGSSGSCTLYKVSAFDPTLVYYDITLTVTEVTQIIESSGYLFLSAIDDNYIGVRIVQNNPLGSGNIVYIDKPSGYSEGAIGVVSRQNDAIFLMPGEESGGYTSLLGFNRSTLIQSITLDLDESGKIITNAKSMTIDSSNNVWVATYTDPINLVKVYYSGGYLYTVYTIGG